MARFRVPALPWPGGCRILDFIPLSVTHESPRSPRPIAIDGVLRVGDLCIVTGGWDTFKSTLCLEMAWSLATGMPFLGNPSLAVVNPLRMGILQAEIDPGSYDERLLAYSPTDNLWTCSDLTYQLTESGVEDLYVTMRELELDGLVLDPLGPMWPSYAWTTGEVFRENAKEHVTPILKAFKQFSKTIVLVHHDPKPSLGVRNRASGTSALLNDPDTRILLDRMGAKVIAQVRSRLQHGAGQIECSFTQKRRLVALTSAFTIV